MRADVPRWIWRREGIVRENYEHLSLHRTEDGPQSPLLTSKCSGVFVVYAIYVFKLRNIFAAWVQCCMEDSRGLLHRQASWVKLIWSASKERLLKKHKSPEQNINLWNSLCSTLKSNSQQNHFLFRCLSW